MVGRGLGAAVVGLFISGAVGALTLGAPPDHPRPAADSAAVAASATPARVPAPVSTAPIATVRPRPPTTVSPTTTVPPTTAAPTTAPPAAPVALAGCPVPPSPPSGPASPPWHPANLVPDSSLPPAAQPAPWHASLAAITGKGMWVWQWADTDGGDAGAVVRQAVGAGLHQIWVRVGDSKYGFYGASELEALVPVAHAAGLSVIAWGFPYLYDPVGDAAWTGQILAWRSIGGQGVDGFSADLERPSEGVDLTARRVAVYLQGLRASAGSRPVIATVYPPLDTYWNGDYPYSTMATYVDAFAPMVYWECTDPGQDAVAAVQRLSQLKPVHVIGQAFDMADVGGRAVAPSAAEMSDFMARARASGAIGASFWVWQSATAEEWSAVTAFRW